MPNEMTVFEDNLALMLPSFEEVVGGIMPVARFFRTAMIAVEKNDKLLKANRQSLFNTIMSAGVLGLEMDGITGQCFPIPFKGMVQLVIGYKGYNTLGARARLAITGEVIREADPFEYRLGTDPFIDHRPRPENFKNRIVGAWAIASSNTAPPIPTIMWLDDILQIKARAPGSKNPDSPWNDTAGPGYAAMVSKTPKRRLQRSLPLTTELRPYHLAAAMESAHEDRGAVSFINEKREVISQAVTTFPAPQPGETPLSADLLKGRGAMSGPIEGAPLEELVEALKAIAAGGKRALSLHWDNQLTPAQRNAAKPHASELLAIASAADVRKSGG